MITQMSRKATMDGNTAAAMASYYFTEVAAIYPITPSSPMAEAVDKWASDGRQNIFGKPVRLIEMQSEGGAAGTLHGSLQAGALSTTYTSSQGLLLMIPNLYKIAGELLPGVLHVSARSLASNALSIFGDHQDVMSIRQTGTALLASGTVQECMDLGVISHLSAIGSRIPFVHFFDGFRTSHEIQKIEVVEEDAVGALLDREAVRDFRDRALNPDHPVLRGTTQNPDIFFQEREAGNKFYQELPKIVQTYMDRFAEETGRIYHLFDYYGAENPSIVMVAMGSSCEVIKETLDHLNAEEPKYGLVQVRLFRPFQAEAFRQAFPESTEKIVVLDRTKEPGANGEPLYQDVCAAFYHRDKAPRILGGRYGLASKDFGPKDVAAIITNAEKENPLNGFTVGIEDDVTHLSLPIDMEFADTAPAGTVNCKFWGLGSDGTVGANKSAVKIIGDHTDKYVQAYFAYDSKKSGGITISHLRFGDSPIRSSYLIDHADYIACHNQVYVNGYDLLEGIKEKGIFLLNCTWDDAELDRHLPVSIKRKIREKGIRFYTIDAVHLGEKLGLGKRINMIMQTAFFALADIIPMEDAVTYLKQEVRKNYGHQGQNVIDRNFSAIDATVGQIHKVDLSVLTCEGDEEERQEISTGKADLDFFVNNIMTPMNRQKGDGIPVSAFIGMEDGTFPTGTSCFEKRGIALEVPAWNPDKCLQCNQCSLVCPHAVFRPQLLSEEELAEAPQRIKDAARPARGYPGKYFYMGFSPMDCTGCGNCLNVCPARENALTMVMLEEREEEEKESWVWLQHRLGTKPFWKEHYNARESQFLPSYFEFSGACAGCGETPYARLITQLFGDRMMISNSAGCATVWGGSAPAVPYRKDDKGHGPAWGFSLFEDNAEYGLGMFLGYQAVREEIKAQLESMAGYLAGCRERKTAVSGTDGENVVECRGQQAPAKAVVTDGEKIQAPEAQKRLAEAVEKWLTGYVQSQGTRERAKELIEALEKNRSVPLAEEVLERKDYLIKRSNWIFGGDGWAYDIGYGGLDHVLSTGADINVMVFDTEVYSNTGGQSSKATPKASIAKFAAAGKQGKKKALGMMAMQYGDVYVAQIALGADPAQALKAVQEAERYPGPSLIIGYAPCVNHGIKGGMGRTREQQKNAVEAGYWNLYRYDPGRKAEGQNPFVLDSGEPKTGFREFLMSEVRFSSLCKKDPALADRLFAEAEQEAMERYERYRKLSGKE